MFEILGLSWPDLLSGTWTGLLYAAALALAAAGFVGCVLPFPGHLFLLGGCVVADIAHGEPCTSWYAWAALVALCLVGTFIDNIATMMGAKRFGCSKAAIWGSFIGLFVGSFFFPFGIIIGPFLGAFIPELALARRTLGASAKSSLGALLGLLAGILLKLLVATLMVVLYLIRL